jgi:hypothetical protein
MKRKIFELIVVAGCSLFWGGCNLIPKKAAVEIMSNPTAKVFLNGKEAGMTPYKNSSLVPGEMEIRLEAANQTWTKKLVLHNNVNTVIDWEFGKEEAKSGGYVLYMENTGDNSKAGLLVNASPDKSSVQIDGEIKGFTPMRLDNIGSGDKQVTISYPAYKGINVFVKAVKGYQLIVEANLASQKEQEAIAEETSYSSLASTPTPAGMGQVKIKQTETGWLRVREQANSSSAEVGKVNPGEKYQLLEEKSGWYQIDLGNNKKGWVSAIYAEKVSE